MPGNVPINHHDLCHDKADDQFGIADAFAGTLEVCSVWRLHFIQTMARAVQSAVAYDYEPEACARAFSSRKTNTSSNAVDIGMI